jgi:ribosomal protein S18 acetylase RimI-like enzyme
MIDIRIEQASTRDAEEILTLQKLAYQSEARLYRDDRIPPLTQTLDEIKAEFSDHRFLKAVLETQIVGSVRAKCSNSICFIGRLIVHPDYQGQGIGSTLMQEIEKHCGNAKRLELFTGHKSEGNIRLYQRLGYTLFKTEQVTKTLSLVFMEKAPGGQLGTS